MFDAHCHLKTQNAYYCEREIKIDKRFPDLPKQTEAAKQELIRAKTNNKPATLHCVQATKLMLDVLKEVLPEPKSVLWHSFNGSPETAKELFKLGVIISLSPKCTKNIEDLVKANPLFALETDYTGTSEEEHKTILENHYKKCAESLKITTDELERKCRENALAFTC